MKSLPFRFCTAFCLKQVPDLRRAVLRTGFLLMLHGLICYHSAAQIPEIQKPDTAYRPGLLARYYPLPAVMPPKARLPKKARPFACRIWPRLHPDTGGAASALYSKNPFLLELSGDLFVPEEGVYHLKMSTSGNAEFYLDGRRIWSAAASAAPDSGTFDLHAGAGPHRLRVLYRAPKSGHNRNLSLLWNYDPQGKFVPVGEEFFRVNRAEVRAAKAEMGLLPGPQKKAELKDRKNNWRLLPRLPKVKSGFDVKSIRQTGRGLVLEFSEALSKDVKPAAEIRYGVEKMLSGWGDAMPEEPDSLIAVPGSRMGRSSKQLVLDIPGLKEGCACFLEFGTGLKNEQGLPLRSRAAWYSLHRMQVKKQATASAP